MKINKILSILWLICFVLNAIAAIISPDITQIALAVASLCLALEEREVYFLKKKLEERGIK